MSGLDALAFLDGALSERALAALGRLRARRVPELVHHRQEIVKRLREARLPMARPILELEESIGGLELRMESAGRGTIVVARLSILGALDALAEEGGPFHRERAGATLVPICLSRGALPFYDLYVDERGHLHELDEIAGGGPIAERWQVLLERLAFGAVRVVPPPATWRVWSPLLVGAPVAAALGAERVVEVSDDYQRLWLAPDVHLSEQAALDDAPAGTTVASSDRDLLARALRAVQEARPDAAVRLSPELLSAATEAAGRTPIVRLPWSPASRADPARELVVIGAPGHHLFVARPSSSVDDLV